MKFCAFDTDNMSSDSELDSPRTDYSTPRSTPDLCGSSTDCYEELSNLHSLACINVKDICRPLSPISDLPVNTTAVPPPERRRPRSVRKTRSPNQKSVLYTHPVMMMPPFPLVDQHDNLTNNNPSVKKRKSDKIGGQDKYAKLYQDVLHHHNIFAMTGASAAGCNEEPLDLRINVKR